MTYILNKVDCELATKYIKNAAENENADAMCEYALFHSNWQGAKNNFEEIIDKGSINAITTYAFISNSNECNKEEAIKYCRIKIDKGDFIIMINYTLMVQEGDGVTMNKGEAIKYYKMAIGIGNTDSMCRYALMLEEEFIKYYKVAIERDSPFPMNRYETILKDWNQSTKEEFIKYIKMAIDKGDSNVMYNFALMLQNEEEAIKYNRMAINKGNEKFITKRNHNWCWQRKSN